jgi:hypothetical protein
MSAHADIMATSAPMRASARALAQRALLAVDAWSTWLALLGSCAVVAALYGRATTFSFFFDDTFDLTRVEGRSYWQLLSSSPGYAYYRPLPFMLWKALRQLQGRYDQATLHTLPLVAHALAGWLLYLLVKRAGAGQWAVFPALLFLTSPFAYQDVPIVGTLFHPLAGAAMLAALVLFQRARSLPTSTRGGSAWHIGALLCTLVALWSHESGVVVAPLLVGLEALTLWRARSWRPSLWLAGHLLATGLFVLTWFSVPKAPSTEHSSLHDLHSTTLFFLQGFSYPFSAQLVWLADHSPVAPGILDAGVAAFVFVLGAYALAAWRTGRRNQLAVPLLGLGVGLAAAAPSMARLSYAYVQDAPRLLYLGGIGAALFWGLLPMLDFRQRALTIAWRTLTIAALCGVVAQSWIFVDLRMRMYARGTRVVNAVVAGGEDYQGQRVVFVNAPAWFAQDRYEYPYGHFGIQVMPSYIGLERVIYASSSRSAALDAASVALNPAVSGGVYAFGPHGASVTFEQLDALLRDGRELFVVAPSGDGFRVRDVGRLQPGQAEQRSDAPGSVGGVWLSHARDVLTKEGLTVYVSWSVLAPPGVDVETVLELRDGAGQPVASYHGYALGGYSAPRLWRAGDVIDDSLLFPTPPPGAYTIWAGLQQVSEGQRLPAAGGVTDAGLVQVGQIVVP